VLDFGPFAEALFNQGPFTDSVVMADLGELGSAGAITVNAGENFADATVADLTVNLTPLATLTADAVSSQCSTDGTNVTGDSSIVNGVVTIDVPIVGPVLIDLDASASPNTTVLGLEGIATVILNRQTVNPDGSLTVDAIFIELLDGQTITIATSSCQPGVLVIPVIAPAFAIGAGVLGLLGFGFFLYRRQSSAPAAA